MGYDVIEKPTNVFHKKDIDLIHINFYPADVDQLYAPTLEVVGDIGNTFRQLYEHPDLAAHLRDFSPIYTTLALNKQKLSDHLAHEYEQDKLGPRRLAKELREHL